MWFYPQKGLSPEGRIYYTAFGISLAIHASIVLYVLVYSYAHQVAVTLHNSRRQGSLSLTEAAPGLEAMANSNSNNVVFEPTVKPAPIASAPAACNKAHTSVAKTVTKTIKNSRRKPVQPENSKQKKGALLRNKIVQPRKQRQKPQPKKITRAKEPAKRVESPVPVSKPDKPAPRAAATEDAQAPAPESNSGNGEPVILNVDARAYDRAYDSSQEGWRAVLAQEIGNYLYLPPGFELQEPLQALCKVDLRGMLSEVTYARDEAPVIKTAIKDAVRRAIEALKSEVRMQVQGKELVLVIT